MQLSRHISSNLPLEEGGIASVSKETSALCVTWDDGLSGRFHYIWLRDNCSCPQCGSHESGSRFQSLLDIPKDISPANFSHDAKMVTVHWRGDNHLSRYPATWLRLHCYSDTVRAGRRLRRIYWDASLSELPTANFAAAEQDLKERHRLFEKVAKYGFVVVRELGTAPDQTLRLAAMLGYVRDTHFGPVTDLTLRANGLHIADYPVGILPHTDETYRATPTGINIFHCIAPCDQGGGYTILVDSHNCALKLKDQDAASFDLLCRLPIQHVRRTERETIRSNQPAFTLDLDGQLTEVRLNERTMSTLSVPEQLMEATYEALRSAFSMAYAPGNSCHLRLEAGDALVCDNLRVLHGRTPVTGRRLLRQTNVMRDEFFARLAALEESLIPTRASSSQKNGVAND
jgi:DUF971 family protein